VRTTSKIPSFSVSYYRLLEAGIEVDIASISRSKINGKHGYEVEANKVLKDVIPDDYALLVLPGGKAPAAIRKEQAALRIAQAFFSRQQARCGQLPWPANTYHRRPVARAARHLLPHRSGGNA